jgi:hypothetical protein
MSKTPPKVFLLAACDRLNLGDLLFPIVTTAALRKLDPSVQVECFGIVAQDLSKWGAIANLGLSDLYERTDRDTFILVAGGELLAQRWLATHLGLVDVGEAASLLDRELRVGREQADCLSREALGGRAPLSFGLRSKDFPGSPKILYNSVGGWPISSLTHREQTCLIEALRDASYVSVRDAESLRLIRGLAPMLSTEYAPDCVFLLSHLFPLSELAVRCRSEVIRWIEGQHPYFCFQCNSEFGRDNKGAILTELRTIIRLTGWRLLLVPIGKITGYDDESFLSEPAIGIDGAELLPSDATLWETAYALASAQAFAGTSLHGVVSAISYDVPAIDLRTADPKLKNNVLSWQIPNPDCTVPVEQLSKAVFACPRSGSQDLIRPRERLQDEAWKSLVSVWQHVKADRA